MINQPHVRRQTAGGTEDGTCRTDGRTVTTGGRAKDTITPLKRIGPSQAETTSR